MSKTKTPAIVNVPATTPKLNKTEQVELLAMHMFEKDKEAWLEWGKKKVALTKKIREAALKKLGAALAKHQIVAERASVWDGTVQYTCNVDVPIPAADKKEQRRLNEEDLKLSHAWAFRSEWGELAEHGSDARRLRRKYMDEAKARLNNAPDLKAMLKMPEVTEVLDALLTKPSRTTPKLVNK